LVLRNLSEATAGCYLSSNIYGFLFFRACQAIIVTASIIPRAIIRDQLSEDDATQKLGYLMMGMTIVPMIGPGIGGLLDQSFGWSASFAFLFIVGLFITILVYVDLGETAPKSSVSIWKQFQSVPQLIASLRFWGYALGLAFSNGVFFLFLSGGPIVGHEVYGLSPGQFGMYFALTPLGYIFGNYISTRAAKSLGAGRTICVALGLCFFGPLSIIFFELFGYENATTFFALIAFIGVGNGLLVPTATIRMLSILPSLIGSASGLGAALMTVVSATLSTMGGFLVTNNVGVLPLTFAMLVTFLAASLIFAATFSVER